MRKGEETKKILRWMGEGVGRVRGQFPDCLYLRHENCKSLSKLNLVIKVIGKYRYHSTIPVTIRHDTLL